MRYYDPITNTEAVKGIHDTDACTELSSDHPWFHRPAREGFVWKLSSKGPWPEEVQIPAPTEEEQQQIAYEQWKQERQQAVDAIKVEVDGIIFDGDELSQSRMTRAATLAASAEETVSWILADNSVAEVTADQLRRAAQAAWIKQGKLWILEKTDVEKKEIQPAS